MESPIEMTKEELFQELRRLGVSEAFLTFQQQGGNLETEFPVCHGKDKKRVEPDTGLKFCLDEYMKEILAGELPPGDGEELAGSITLYLEEGYGEILYDRRVSQQVRQEFHL